MRSTLTPRQQNVRNAIVAFEQRTGVNPTLRELQHECGFASPTAAHDHVLRLERKGAIYVYRPESASGPWRIASRHSQPAGVTV